MTGRIFDIQRFSTHDGPGIRTTVFLKGCPLRCLWCHNPEGLRPDPQLAFAPDRCVACGGCIAACPGRAHRLEAADGRTVHVFDRPRCRSCGTCAAACVSGALESVGREASVDEVLREVIRDRVFYETSGGGLTLSGGEPLLQPGFAAELLGGARGQGLHCALETSGFAPWRHLETLLDRVDLFLFDFKETDPERHRQFTGVPNGEILANLRALHDRGARVALRCPIIPGCNDREDHFAGIAALAAELPGLADVELLVYHPLGRAKAARLGLDAPPAAAVPDRAVLRGWADGLARRGVRVRFRAAGRTGRDG
jgi:pyruvate formate lyase activating enzyme